MLQATVRDEVSSVPVTMQLHGNRAAMFVAADPCRRIDAVLNEGRCVVARQAIRERVLDSFGAILTGATA